MNLSASLSPSECLSADTHPVITFLEHPIPTSVPVCATFIASPGCLAQHSQALGSNTGVLILQALPAPWCLAGSPSALFLLEMGRAYGERGGFGAVLEKRDRGCGSAPLHPYFFSSHLLSSSVQMAPPGGYSCCPGRCPGPELGRPPPGLPRPEDLHPLAPYVLLLTPVTVRVHHTGIAWPPAVPWDFAVASVWKLFLLTCAAPSPRPPGLCHSVTSLRADSLSDSGPT